MKHLIFIGCLLATFSAFAQKPAVKYRINETNFILKSPIVGTDYEVKLKPGDTILITGWVYPFWLVKKGTHEGYMHYKWVPITDELREFRGDPKPDNYQWPTDIKIGLKIGEVTHILGEPTTINKTETTNVIYYQYVYSKSGEKTKYYYFENGILTGIQN